MVIFAGYFLGLITMRIIREKLTHYAKLSEQFSQCELS